MSNYRFSNHSKGQLIGLYPDLGFMFSEGLKITKQDFILFDGVRTTAQQVALVARGVSKTLDSYHLYGLAGDAVPWHNGRPRWDEELFVELISALKQVIKTHGLPIQNGFDLWGWDMAHWQMSGFKSSYDVRKYKHDLICK